MKPQKTIGNRLLIGRDEWCDLASLGVPAIKAKIDTGAKTSSIHAFNIRVRKGSRNKVVYFDILPRQRRDDVVLACKATVVDEREIMSSNGHKEHRYIIRTKLSLGGKSWTIEVSLSNRDPLQYRMLLGRDALVAGKLIVDPAMSCNQRKLTLKEIDKIYQ